MGVVVVGIGLVERCVVVVVLVRLEEPKIDLMVLEAKDIMVVDEASK